MHTRGFVYLSAAIVLSLAVPALSDAATSQPPSTSSPIAASSPTVVPTASPSSAGRVQPVAALVSPVPSKLPTSAPSASARPSVAATLSPTASPKAAPTSSPVAVTTPPVVIAPLPGTLVHDSVAPTRGTLPSGLRYVLQPLSSQPNTAVQLWFRAPSDGFASDSTPSLASLAALAVAASEVDGQDSLSQTIQAIGGTISTEVFPDAIEVNILVPAEDAVEAIALATQAYGTPSLTDTGLKKAAFELSTQSLLDRIDIFSTVTDELFANLFATGPARLPVLDLPGLARLTVPELKAFARRAFRPDNTTLVVCGAVPTNASHVIASVAHHGDGPEEPVYSTTAVPALSTTVTAAVSGIGLAWAGPPIEDARAATAMDFIADYLFSDHGGVVTTDLARTHPLVQLVGQYVTFRAPGVFYVEALGENGRSVAPELEAAIDAMKTPLDAATFSHAREAFITRLESGVANPAGLAASIGWYGIEGNPAYAPGLSGEKGVYFSTAWQLTPEFIAHTAQKYLSAKPAQVRVLSLAGKKSAS